MVKIEMKTYRLVAILISYLLFLAALVQADTFWQATTGNWGESIHWSDGEPTSSDWVYINNGGTSEITEEGEVCKFLTIGDGSNDTGYVDMSGGSLTAWLTSSSTIGNEVVGNYGVGRFDQSGGINTIRYSLTLGAYSGSVGTYELSGTGELSSRYETIGSSGTGTFRQTGGTNTASDFQSALVIGDLPDSNGSYELSGTGQLFVPGHEVIGNRGKASFTQSDGTHSVDYYLYIGNLSSGNGSYDLSGTGQLSAAYEQIGVSGSGEFIHTGGTNNVTNNLSIAFEPNSKGTYILSGQGQLTVDSSETVGRRGIGTFIQSGGTNEAYQIFVGDMTDSNGTYTISDGELNVENLIIAGSSGSVGTFSVSGSDANITVSNLLRFGPGIAFTAVPGATIHMTGSNFENQSKEPNNLMGLNNLEFIFEGGSADIDIFEVGGADFGPAGKGLNVNFAMDALTLGGADIGKVKLVDSVDNQNDGALNEVLYVHSLNISAGSYLDLNGLKLYYANCSIDPAATIIENGGSLSQILMGDFEPDGDVDLIDFSIFSSAWITCPNDSWWDWRCDIAEPRDDFIDELDLFVLVGNWLTGVIP